MTFINEQLDCVWGFGVPDEQVDVERIYLELMGIPAIFAASYLGELRKRSPRVWERLRDWCNANGKLALTFVEI